MIIKFIAKDGREFLTKSGGDMRIKYRGRKIKER